MTFYSPGEAAKLLGVPVPTLATILRKHRYPFTELSPGGKPGDRGRNRWGLTQDQLEAVLEGQARGWAVPSPRRPTSSAGPDGIRRLK